MITGKIVLKSATKLSLNQRFSEIAKQAPPPPPRIPQQTNVIIPQSRQELFVNKRSAAVSVANRLKKRSINYRRGNFNNLAPARPFVNPRPAHVFQRISFGNRRRGGGASSYVYGGQSGMGVRLGGDGRVGTRVFHSQRRGYLNNNAVSRFGRYQRRGYNTNVGNRGGRFFNRPYRGRGIDRGFGRGAGRGTGRGNRGFGRGRGRGNNRNNPDYTKESLDNDLDKYMSQTKIDNDSVDMSAI